MPEIDFWCNFRICFIQAHTVFWAWGLTKSLAKLLKNSHRKIRVRKNVIMCLMNQEPYGKLLILLRTGFTKRRPKSTQVLAWLCGGKSAFLFLLLISAVFTDGHGLPVHIQILQWNTPNFLLLVSSTKKGEISFSRSPLLTKALQGYFGFNL